MSTIAFDPFALTRIADFARPLSRLHKAARHRAVDDDEIDREFNAVCQSVWGYSTDDISDDTLAGELTQVLQQLSKQGFTFDSTTADKTDVDGARSFGYHASQRSTGLESDVYFVFRGRNELQVNCQWKDKEADIGRGCKAVLGTLQFKSVK